MAVLLRGGSYSVPPAVQTNPTTLYSLAGASGVGTEEDPCSLADVQTALVSGGDITVYLAGDYTVDSSFLKFDGSTGFGGTATTWVKLIQWPGMDTAILHGDATANGFAPIYVVGEGFIYCEGLTFNVNRATTDHTVYLINEAHNVTFVGCTLLRAEARVGIPSADGGGYDIWFYGCVFSDPDPYVSNEGDGLYIINGSGQASEDVYVISCAFLNWPHACITTGGIQTGSAAGGTCYIADTTFFNRYAGGINMNENSRSVTIERCTILESGLDNVTPEAGTQDGILVQGEDNIVRYNRIYRTNWNGITLEKYNAATTVKGNFIFHNTIFDCCQNAARLYDAPIRLYANTGDLTTDFINNEITNNVCWRTDSEFDGAGTFYPLVILTDSVDTDWPVGNLGDNVFRNNVVGTGQATQNFIMDRGTGRNVAGFVGTYAASVGNLLTTDPLFVDESTVNLALQSSSPAKDAGYRLRGVPWYGSAPDAGYIEEGTPNTFGSQTIRDAFNRADENPLAGGWTKLITAANAMRVVSNGAKSASGTGSAYWSGQAFGPECEAYVTMTTRPAASKVVILLARIADPGTTFDGYAVTFTVTDALLGTISYFRYDNGSGTSLGSTTEFLDDGDRIGLSISGDTLTAYKEVAGQWCALPSVTDSTYSAAGYLGIGLTDTVGVLDDFGGGGTLAGGLVGSPIPGRFKRLGRRRAA